MQGPHLHFVAIGGTAMAPLAVLLSRRGFEITGSDTALYPPMSDLIARSGISVAQGFRPENLPANCDAVVVGNAVPASNLEVLAVVARGLPMISLPEAIGAYLLRGRHAVVVAGTHGKTTTSALAAWLLTSAGRDPSFLVGGELANFGAGFRDGAGPHVVLEGDEYNAAYFDRGPKFWHYQPRTLVVNNIEFDHGDLYPDLAAIQEVFGRLVELVPPGGSIVANVDDGGVRAALTRAKAAVIPVSLESREGYFAADVEAGPAGTSFTLVIGGRAAARMTSPLSGVHNLRNALSAAAAVISAGLSPEEVATHLPGFLGVRRRLEVLGERDGITYVDDFAHHPTAVRETLRSARQRWPGRRIWAVFEPRSMTAGRRVFQAAYERALAEADAVILAPVFHAARFAASELIDRNGIIATLATAGRPGFAPEGIEETDGLLSRFARSGDVVLLMSSGDFGGLRKRVASAAPGGPGGF